MLTDSTCKNAKCPEGKTKFRLADSGGLYLEVSPNGSKRWFWKYRFDGKEKRLALGHYMEAGSRKVQVPLKDARQLRDDSSTSWSARPNTATPSRPWPANSMASRLRR